MPLNRLRLNSGLKIQFGVRKNTIFSFLSEVYCRFSGVSSIQSVLYFYQEDFRSMVPSTNLNKKLRFYFVGLVFGLHISRNGLVSLTV